MIFWCMRRKFLIVLFYFKNISHKIIGQKKHGKCIGIKQAHAKLALYRSKYVFLLAQAIAKIREVCISCNIFSPNFWKILRQGLCFCTENLIKHGRGFCRNYHMCLNKGFETFSSPHLENKARLIYI